MSGFPEIELISFDLCPFVQRSVITLNHKNVDSRITYIDLADKPDWFLQISPLGKVPVMRLNDQDVLFESAVINEYLDEITPPSLHPENPLTKAQNRAWIEVGSNQIIAQYKSFLAKDQASFEAARAAYISGFDAIEAALTGPFFNGSELSLVDSAWAPIFTRHRLMEQAMGSKLLENHPNVSAWMGALLVLPAVQNSVKPEFDQIFRDYWRDKESYVGSKLVASEVV